MKTIFIVTASAWHTPPGESSAQGGRVHMAPQTFTNKRAAVALACTLARMMGGPGIDVAAFDRVGGRGGGWAAAVVEDGARRWSVALERQPVAPKGATA